MGVEVPFKNCDWFSKYFELLTPCNAGIAPEYILLHLDYGNSWPFSITQRVKGRRSPAVLWSTPAEFPVTVALWYWLEPFAQLDQVRCIASNYDRLFNTFCNHFCWTNKPFNLDHNPQHGWYRGSLWKNTIGKEISSVYDSLWRFPTLVLTNLLIEYLSRIDKGERDEMGWTRKRVGGPLCRQAKTETFKGAMRVFNSSSLECLI